MVSIQPFRFEDLWSINRINNNKFTETYYVQSYLSYMNKSPEMNLVISNNSGEKMGYIIASAKGKEDSIKGHIIALSVCEDERRLGVGTTLMKNVENVCENKYKGHCVSLHVRPTNFAAQELYKKMGYIYYRTVLNYYSKYKEDGFDMRKSLKYDTEKKFMVSLKDPVSRDEAELDDE